MPPARLWIALTRPDNLVTALAVAAAGKGRFGACHLLHENTAWWKQVDLATCPPLFDHVHQIEKVRTCRGLRDLPRLYRELRDRQRALARLGIAPEDTIVTLAGLTELSVALASAYPGVNKLLCTTVQKYVDANRPISLARHRPTTAGWLRRWLLEPRLGLRRTIHLKPWRGGGDGVRLNRLEEPLENLFEAILLMSNDGREVPSPAGRKVHPSPFPALRDLDGWMPAPGSGEGNRSGKVVFFGTPFLLVRNLSPAVYRDRLDDCLDGLRRWYGSTCELVYRPHPAETGESGELDLEGFVIEDDRQVAELYFLKKFRQIRAVFAVSSTVSRVALNYGLNSYVLWPCFPFDATAQSYFSNLMGRVPPEFEIRTLDRPPVVYADHPSQTLRPTTSFQGVIQDILDQWQRDNVNAETIASAVTSSSHQEQ